MNKPSRVDVFSGTNLDKVVDKAQVGCPIGYEVIDINVKYLNNLWIVISKIAKAED